MGYNDEEVAKIIAEKHYYQGRAEAFEEALRIMCDKEYIEEEEDETE